MSYLLVSDGWCGKSPSSPHARMRTHTPETIGSDVNLLSEAWCSCSSAVLPQSEACTLSQVASLAAGVTAKQTHTTTRTYTGKTADRVTNHILFRIYVCRYICTHIHCIEEIKNVQQNKIGSFPGCWLGLLERQREIEKRSKKNFVT